MQTKTIFSFKQAIENECSPRDYQFNKDVPVGVFEVKLDFKVWAKQSVTAVTCFCTILETEQKIRFNIFRNQEGDYLLPKTNLDFCEMSYDTIFKILVERNTLGNIKVSGVNL